MVELKETCMECTNDKNTATFCSNEQKWINKIYKLAEKHQNEVQIMKKPEDNNGYILVHVPKSWMKLSPPKQVNYTDEQRAALAERMSMARQKAKEGGV